MGAEPTELEHCVLAEIRRLQPCSAYAVRRVFAESPTPDWSGSTGAIYPVIRRLAERGLITADVTGDVRGRKNLAITSQGEAAVATWLEDLSAPVAKATADPIRTRLAYLDQLQTREGRYAFLETAIRLTEAAILDLMRFEDSAREQGAYGAAATIGALRQLEARRTWLEEVLAEI